MARFHPAPVNRAEHDMRVSILGGRFAPDASPVGGKLGQYETSDQKYKMGRKSFSVLNWRRDDVTFLPSNEKALRRSRRRAFCPVESGREDLNLRLPGPKPGALARLAPRPEVQTKPRKYSRTAHRRQRGAKWHELAVNRRFGPPERREMPSMVAPEELSPADSSGIRESPKNRISGDESPHSKGARPASERRPCRERLRPGQSGQAARTKVASRCRRHTR